MNQSKTSPTADGSGWTLVATKGREVGRGYALAPGETILGSAPPRDRGLDLASQEENGTRSLAGRHAAIEAHDGVLKVRDLESPGGTFVNRQRLLSGQSRSLNDGDLIQLGGVKLRVERRADAAPTALAPISSKAAPTSPFLTAKGARCASWDDFLVLAARDWQGLRDELASGRLLAYLQRIGRPDLAPAVGGDHSFDEKLDLWLGRLPATLSAAPELDVHPATLVVTAAGGGGVVTRTLKITNVGYRLLRSTARVEPAACDWLRIKGDRSARPMTTIDHTELELEIEIPEVLGAPLEGAIMIDSNGGSKRIGARLERAQVVAEPDATAGREPSFAWSAEIDQRLGRLAVGHRVVLGALLAAALRVLLLLIAWSPLGRLSAGGVGLASVATAMAGAGILMGAILGRTRGSTKDALAMGFTGGAVGLIVSAVLVAMVQSLDAPQGQALAIPVWGALGAVAGLLSVLIKPTQTPRTEVAP